MTSCYVAIGFVYRSRLFKQIVLFTLVVVSNLFCGGSKQNHNRVVVGASSPRVISCAPSITETIYALHGESHLVGVSNFCTFPSDVTRLPRIGGYLDPNYEQILRLHPDLAILVQEHAPLIAFLNKYSIRTVTIDNSSIATILAAISSIAAACNLPSDSLVAALRHQLESSELQLEHAPRILFAVGRDKPGSGTIGKVFIAGPKTFYSELITRAGAKNAFSNTLAAYPSISGESIIRLNPDIIIEVAASAMPSEKSKIRADWKALAMVPAVKTGDVFILTAPYISIPGPRITETYKDILRCITLWLEHQDGGASS